MHLLNNNVKEYIGKAHGTAGLAHITKGKFETSQILLPPFNEQRRITNKVEELFSFLDAGVASLRAVQAQLKRYRQAVLKHAFEGKLTEQWRKAHKGQIESAQELLEEIRMEQNTNSRIKSTHFPEIETLNLPKLPDNWTWAYVGEVTRLIQYGYTASAISDPIGPKMLRITDIQENMVDWSTVPYCAIEDSLKQKYLLKYGDLVFARTGATVGKSFLIKGEIPETVFASYLIRVTFSNKITEEYVYNFFQSLFYWAQIRKNQVGIGQPNVNSQVLSRIIFPLPPQKEQSKIIEEIEMLFSIISQQEKSVNLSLIISNKLRQSILKTAFSGNLVFQEPSDEPAEKLLECIKEERLGNKSRNNNQVELSKYVK